MPKTEVPTDAASGEDRILVQRWLRPSGCVLTRDRKRSSLFSCKGTVPS